MLSRSLPLFVRAGRFRLRGVLSTSASWLLRAACELVPPLRDGRLPISVPMTITPIAFSTSLTSEGGCRSLAARRAIGCRPTCFGDFSLRGCILEPYTSSACSLGVWPVSLGGGDVISRHAELAPARPLCWCPRNDATHLRTDAATCHGAVRLRLRLYLHWTVLFVPSAIVPCVPLVSLLPPAILRRRRLGHGPPLAGPHLEPRGLAWRRSA
jgi:hypothetical protein